MSSARQTPGKLPVSKKREREIVSVLDSPVAIDNVNDQDDTDNDDDNDDFFGVSTLIDTGPDALNGLHRSALSEDEDDNEADVDLDASDEDDELLSDSERNLGSTDQSTALIQKMAKLASYTNDSYEEDFEDSGIDSKKTDDSTSNNDEQEVRFPEIEPLTDSDDSDLEVTENTVGDIPMEWYNDFPHIGYDVDGKRIMRPAVGDALDQFLAKMDDPNSWKSVYNKQDMKDTVLTDAELDIVQRIQNAEYANVDFDPYQPTIEWFTSHVEKHPLSNAPEPKSRFVPSKWEATKVMKIVRAIRKGLIVRRNPKTEQPIYYDLWKNDKKDQLESEKQANHPMYLPAPKRRLPGHIESYNPPEEYLMNKKGEMNIGRKYNSLRQVPGYDKFIHEQFGRCLDLYLCPRAQKKRVDIDPESLLPKLPNPKDLEPFPTRLSITYTGHTSRVRSFSISPNGQYILSGSDDKTARIWEVSSGRCLHQWRFQDMVVCVAWSPHRSMCTALIACGNDVYVVDVGTVFAGATDYATMQYTTTALKGEVSDGGSNKVSWRRPTAKLAQQGVAWVLQHTKTVTYVTWHKKGDYFASVAPDAGHSSILIHQLSRKLSQQPFKKTKGLAIRVLFHPTRAHFIVATQRYVRVYDLQRQELIKKLISGVRWISSLDIHPAGENVIVGSYDKRLCWWDLELGVTPYRTLRYHKQALRSVAFHKQYPLFASSSDDGTIQVFHGTVYNDLMSNPLIVPVKILRAHQPVDNLGALDIVWHPTQPWIVSAGADGLLKLWV